MKNALRFKLADSPAEFESIHRVNDRTFVDEIPQHLHKEYRRLVDRLAQICLMGRRDPHALDVLPEVPSTQMQARSAPAEERHPATRYVPAA